MKTFNNSILRCVSAIVLGTVLILWPETAITYLVMAIGACFIIPGICTLLNYFTRKKTEGMPDPMFPIDGAGSILLGIWLVVTPKFFVGVFMYILGILLLIAGTQQIVTLMNARKRVPVPFGFYVVPVLILLTGVMILIHPFRAAADTFVLFGVASLIYGIAELVNWYKFRPRKRIKNDDIPSEKFPCAS